MRYALPAILLTCQIASAGAPRTGAPEPPPVFERWDAAYLEGTRAGYVRTTVSAKPGGQMHGLVEFRLKIKRINEIMQLGMDTATYETPDGVVTGTHMKQYLGKAQDLVIQGKVDGTRINLTLNNKTALDPAPWDARVVGIARQQRLFQERKLKPGDQITYKSFEPQFNVVVDVRVTVMDYEMVELAPGEGKQKLLRVELKGNPVQSFQPPSLTTWINDEGAQLRSEVEMPGLGSITLIKTTREKALAPAAAATVLETNRIIPLDIRLPRAHDMSSATYRIRVKDAADPAAGFSADNRQAARNVKGDTFDMTVRRVIVAQAEKVRPEYLESSHFINSADAKVREHARLAVEKEKDPWVKAGKIEKYVATHMKASAQESLATADHVARTMTGDCTEFAMLTTAMCRAEGIPSRTAIGLVYGEIRGKPSFVFHMWTEVWVRGQWLGLDATLGRGGIGAAHVKISDQSWHNENSMTPLLPTLNLLGRVSIEVLRAE